MPSEKPFQTIVTRADAITTGSSRAQTTLVVNYRQCTDGRMLSLHITLSYSFLHPFDYLVVFTVHNQSHSSCCCCCIYCHCCPLILCLSYLGPVVKYSQEASYTLRLVCLLIFNRCYKLLCWTQHGTGKPIRPLVNPWDILSTKIGECVDFQSTYTHLYL